jgi:hypothetical protein
MSYAASALDAHLGHTAILPNSARSTGRREASSALVQETRLTALPAPPSIGAMQAIVAKEGAAGLSRLASERKAAGDPDPLPDARLVALTFWMGEQDYDATAMLDLARLRAGLFPGSARAQFAYAQRAKGAGDTATAAAAFAAARKALETDNDPVLTDALRTRIRDAR